MNMNSQILSAPKRSKIRLCGFGSVFRYTESLWCIVSKICWANSISGTVVEDLVLSGGGLKMRFAALTWGKDLQFAKFAEMTNIERSVLIGGTGCTLCKSKDRLLNLAYSKLRYCEVCMASGFHSILNQFPIYFRCPAHGTNILDRCRICGVHIDYFWPMSSQKAFRCPCGHPLWVPQQKFTRNDQGDQFEDAAYRAAKRIAVKWMGESSRFYYRGAALRHWTDMAVSVFPEVERK
jgi:hypothetical protein